MKLLPNAMLLVLEVAFMCAFATKAATSKPTTPISLNVVSDNGFVGFAIQLEISGDTRGFGPQQMLFDTGSSALVFCNKALRNPSVTTPLKYPGRGNVLYLGKPNGQCIGGQFLMGNSYGGNPNINFWGYVYDDDLLITNHGDTNNLNAITMSQVAYAIAEEVGNQFLCKSVPGFNGIWGAGFFRAGNDAHVLMPGFNNPSDVLCFTQSCSSTTFDPIREWCYCDGTGSSFFYLEPVVNKALQNASEPLIGIYLPTSVSDYSTLLKSRITYNAGMVFPGGYAVNNKHYQENPIDAIVISDNDGYHRFWDLPMTSIQVYCGSTSNPDNAEPIMWLKTFCLQNGCILDSGTPKLVFPKSIVKQITSCTADEGTILIKMTGGELRMGLKNLKSLHLGGWIVASDSYGGMIILGFPTWLWYYIVFDYGSGVEGRAEISFVSTP